MKKDLQILWATVKYHLRKFSERFKEDELLNDGHGHYYYKYGSLQRVLYWKAYHRWQTKRYERGQCNIGTDLFERDTNISDGCKKH